MNEVNHVCGFPEFSPPTDTYKNVKKKKKRHRDLVLVRNLAKKQSDGTENE